MAQGSVAPNSRTPQLPPGFDPSKWVYDERTHEFHKVKSRIDGVTLIDLEIYEKRYTVYLHKALQARNDKIITAIAWAVLLLCIISMSEISNFSDKLSVAVLFVFPAVLLTGLYSVKAVFASTIGLPLAKANVGPPPPPRPGREMVERQKVHGEGGILDGDRLRQAARGGSMANEGARPVDTYDD